MKFILCKERTRVEGFPKGTSGPVSFKRKYGVLPN